MPKTNTQRYCLLCGTPLIARKIEHRSRGTCPACGWVLYEQLKVGVGAVLEKDGCILLLRRAADPWRGHWNLPAGFVEVDEAPGRAAEREAWEETGLIVQENHLIEALYYDDDPRGNGVLLVYACDIVDGVLQNNFESSEFRFFAPHEIPDCLCGAGQARAIRSWQKMNHLRYDSVENLSDDH